MIHIANNIIINDWEYSISTMCAQGPGGQHVNKVSTAVHLRFDIKRSALPQVYKEKLLALSDKRITNDGVIIIKAQNFRSQIKNKADAEERLKDLIVNAMITRKKRKATTPTLASQKRRRDQKSRRGEIKRLRGRVDY